MIALILASALAAQDKVPTAAAPPRCDLVLPTGAAPLPGSRPLEPRDLAALRDIGPVDPEPFAAPFFTISPDGRRVAFQLRRPDPDRNLTCLAMVVMDLSPGAKPRIVDRGGDLLLLSIDLRGAGDFPTGITAPVTPRWSPDGRWIAFLKRAPGGAVQVWRAMADGSGSTPITRSPVDVADFRFADDGRAIAYAAKAGLEQARAGFVQEAMSGYHYDDRYSPFASNLPFPAAPVPRLVRIVDIATGKVRDAGKAESVDLASGSELIATAGAPANSSGDRGLWIASTGLTGGAARASFHARSKGRTFTCAAAACEGALKPWRMPDGSRIRFFRREGWARASTAIYEWSLDTGRVGRLYLTDDVLADCAPEGEALICLRESSLVPRQLERLDPVSGRRTLLFDPNPEFARLALGKVRRLKWSNSLGLDTLADLVFPVGYRKGRRYPLVVVQYDTRGFLRGGTGDEYPIQAFANRGYAVLSFRRPQAAGDVRGAKDFKEGRRLNLAGFADRRSVQSSLERGVQLAIDLGIADPDRIGITGLSDGASTATWALIHSSLFRAAAMSTCCIDTTLAMRVGPAAARDFISVGYPGMLERNDPFWKELSLSANASSVHTPILLQLSDDEYLDSLESYSTLREAGAPVDLFLFPEEHHVKWQPAHRLAIYRRSIDWFDYWLRGIRPKAPDRLAELTHWDELRSETEKAPQPPATGGPASARPSS